MSYDTSPAFNLNDYDVSYDEFSTWILENKITAYALSSYGGNGGKYYFFRYMQDFTAFTLKFSKACVA